MVESTETLVYGAATKPEPVLQARKLCKTYQMGEITVTALQDVDLDLYQGELAVLLGASGSGKSTLLNIIGGLDVPTSGKVLYQDRELPTQIDRELTDYRRMHVGFVFQFYNLIPSLRPARFMCLIARM